VSNDRNLAFESFILSILRKFAVVSSGFVSHPLQDLRSVSFTQIEENIYACFVDDSSVGVRQAHPSKSHSLNLIFGLIRFQKGVPVHHADDALVGGLAEHLCLYLMH
jgi:hypothetical protein